LTYLPFHRNRRQINKLHRAAAPINQGDQQCTLERA
jgi:hypothetical protein